MVASTLSVLILASAMRRVLSGWLRTTSFAQGSTRSQTESQLQVASKASRGGSGKA